MKYIWDDGDRGWWHGHIVQTGSKGEKWLIGYDSTVEGLQRFTLVSLRDGMIGERMTPEELALRLNEGGYAPLLVFEKVPL